jgi:hypothetical protein
VYGALPVPSYMRALRMITLLCWRFFEL